MYMHCASYLRCARVGMGMHARMCHVWSVEDNLQNLLQGVTQLQFLRQSLFGLEFSE